MIDKDLDFKEKLRNILETKEYDKKRARSMDIDEFLE